MLVVDVEKQLGDFKVAAKFETPDGVTALFGPSGSGKTSIVNMVAGLLTPDRGRISCNGTLLFDSTGGLSLPPHRGRQLPRRLPDPAFLRPTHQPPRRPRPQRTLRQPAGFASCTTLLSRTAARRTRSSSRR